MCTEMMFVGTVLVNVSKPRTIIVELSQDKTLIILRLNPLATAIGPILI